ncbi:hypothetical protein [Pikeienuella sp. HZG-20]|uniref:hypothetical protein n=1 Tax=Paludibacillus litoralis TaxID=3133267 RepID=UPI0030EBFC20
MSFFGGFKKLIKPVLVAAAVAAVVATAGAAAPVIFGTALAGTTVGGAIMAAGANIIAAAAIAGATTAAGILLGPKPKSTGFAATAAVRQAAFNLPIVYGRTRVGGGMLLYHLGETDDSDLIVAVAVACHEIDEYKKIYAGDVLLYDAANGGSQFPAEKLDINLRLGTVDQGTPPIIGTQLDLPVKWELHGVAYYVLRFRNYAENWASGVGAFWSEVQGCADVYDPATETRGYTNNWALCVADYLTRKRGGGKYEYGVDIDIPALTQAAAISAEGVSEDGGTNKRYTLNGVIDTGIAPGTVLRDLGVYGLGQPIQSGGKISLVAGRAITPSGTITQADLASPLTIDSSVDFEDYPDGARGVYSRFDGRFQSDSYPAVVLDDAPAQPNMINVDLPMCTKPERAQRLVSGIVRQGRRTRTVITGLFSEFLGAVAGTIYNVDLDDFGIEGPFEIVSSSIEITSVGAQVRVTMLEYSLTLFDTGSVTQPPVFADSTLPSPLIVAAPTGVSAVAETVLLGDGTTQSNVLVTWDAVSGIYDLRYDVRWKPAGGDYRSRRSSSTSYLIQGEPRGVALTVEVRAVNLYGGKSEWVSAGTATPSEDVTAPPVPSVTIGTVAGGFVFNVAGSYVYPADFSHFRLYEGASGAAFGATSEVLSAGGRQSQFRRDGLAADTARSYYVTAVDHTGNESAPSARKDGTTPTSLTQEEIDSAISEAVTTANEAQEAVDQVIIDVAENRGNIDALESRVSAGPSINVVLNSEFSIGAAVNEWPDYWRTLGESSGEYLGGLLSPNSLRSGAAEGMQPIYLRRLANAVDQDARILNFSSRDGALPADRGVPVREGRYIEISANVGAINCAARLALFFLDAAGAPVGPAFSSDSTATAPIHHPEQFDRLWVGAECPAGATRAMLEAIMPDSTNPAVDAWMFVFRPQITQGEAGATEPRPYAPSSTVDLNAEVVSRQIAITNEQQARALAITQTEAALKDDLRGSTEVSQLSLADIEGMLKSSVLIRSVAGKYEARIGVLAGNDGTSKILLDANDVIVKKSITAASGLIGDLAVTTLTLAGEAVTNEKIGQEAVSRPYNGSRGNGGVLFTVNLQRAGYISARVYAVVDVPAGTTRQLKLNIDGVTRRTVGASAPAGGPLSGVMLIASVAVPASAGNHSIAGQFSNPQPAPVNLFGDALGIYA